MGFFILKKNCGPTTSLEESEGMELTSPFYLENKA